MNTLVILALIKTLTQEVNLLEFQLAQLEASSSVAVVTTTPIVFPAAYHQWTPPASTPTTTTQSQTLGAAESTSSCSLSATEVGDTNNPQTDIQWTLNGLPTSTMGQVNTVAIDLESRGCGPNAVVSQGEYGGICYETSTMDSMNLENQQTGPFPGQNETLGGGWFQSITANFDGTICSVTPNPHQ
jgi:hypothetical protein